jgi:hypothetical protein
LTKIDLRGRSKSVDWQGSKNFCQSTNTSIIDPKKNMKPPFRLAIGSIFASTILINFGSIATADPIRKVGVVAVIYDVNNNISGLASSIAIGKNAAAGTASIVGNEAATSAVGGAGTLTVTSQNTPNVNYRFEPEATSNPGTISTFPSRQDKVRIDSNTTPSSQAITIIP